MLIVLSMVISPVASYATESTVIPASAMNFDFDAFEEFLQQAPLNGPNPFSVPQSKAGSMPQPAGLNSAKADSIPLAPDQIGMTIPEGSQGLGEFPVDLPAGELKLEHKELDLPGNGFPFILERNYTGETDVAGPFGKGWRTELGSYLTMYADFHMAEIHDDGTTITYHFVKDDSNGYVFSYDGDNKLNYNLEKGHYETAENGNVLKRVSSTEYIVEHPDGSVTKYNGYIAPWRSGQSTDAGKITEHKDAFENIQTYSYDTNGKIASVQNSAGRTVTFEWQNDLLQAVHAPDEMNFIYQYNGEKRLSMVTGPENETTAYEYDTSGRLRKVTEADEVSVTYAYNPQGKVQTIKDAYGVVRYRFEYAQNTVKITDGENHQWTYKYNNDNLISRTSPLGEVVTYTYDSDDNETSVTTTTGTVEKTYDDKGRVTQYKDEAGNTTSTQYEDQWDKPQKMITSDGIVTTYAYDDQGNLIQEKTNGRPAKTFEYDAKGRLTKMAYDGKTSQFTYADNGNLVHETTSTGAVISYEYDGSGRMTAAIYPGGVRMETTYDKAGRMLIQRDAFQNETHYQYNAAGRLTGVTYPNGKAVNYTYDNAGRIQTVKDLLGHTTEYVYDNTGRILQTKAEGLAVSVERDAIGRILKQVEPGGKTTMLQYNVHGLEKVSGPWGDFQYAYDHLGRVKSISDTLGRTAFLTYDAQGNIRSRTDAAGRTSTFTYDAFGNRLSETLPDGQVYHYDYDASGRMTKAIHPDGATVEAQYDKGNRVVSVKLRDGSSLHYEYDAMGYLTAETDPAGHRTQYVYDSLGRLIET